jgi:hypothetical protein
MPMTSSKLGIELFLHWHYNSRWTDAETAGSSGKYSAYAERTPHAIPLPLRLKRGRRPLLCEVHPLPDFLDPTLEVDMIEPQPLLPGGQQLAAQEKIRLLRESAAQIATALQQGGATPEVQKTLAAQIQDVLKQTS